MTTNYVTMSAEALHLCTGFGSRLICEQFSAGNVALFDELVRFGRIADPGYCLPNARTGQFPNIEAARWWIEQGQNVYADVLLSEESR